MAVHRPAPFPREGLPVDAWLVALKSGEWVEAAWA